MSYLMPNFAPAATQSALSNIEPFPDPFCDYASLAMPATHQNALRWCEYILLNNNIYSSAIKRIISYFITELEITGVSQKDKQDYLDYLHDTLGIMTQLGYVGWDFLCYGNTVTSLTVPFRRSLSCPGCGFEAPLDKIDAAKARFGYAFTGYQFQVDCPFCSYKGPWTHIDRRSAEQDDLSIKRWNIHELDLQWDPYTEETGHIWRIPAYYKTHINQGRLFQLARAPWEVIQAVKNNQYIQLDPDVVFHAKEDTLCGVLNKGWGISRVLTNFRQAWYVQVLHRYNEAIGLDYIIPFRVITPAPRTGSGGANGMMSDPVFSADMGGVTGAIHGMLRQRRRDPTSWHSLPFPIQYQALGGDANQFTPSELLELGRDDLLNGIGIPIEFYKGTLTIQAGPTALRLMESLWSPLSYMLNRFLQWTTNKLRTALSWEEFKIQLKKPSHADDLNRQLAKLQLTTAGLVSRTTGLDSVGLSFTEEEKKKLEEQKFVAEHTQEAEEEIQAMGLGDQMAQAVAQGGAPGAMAGPGGAPPGAAPAPGGPPAPGAPVMPPAAGGDGAAAMPGAPGMMPPDPVSAILAQLPQTGLESISPEELHAIADTISTQIFALPSSQRISALRKLKEKNDVVHSLVKSKLDSMTQQAQMQGQQMAQQSAQAASQGSMAPPPPM
jgi:hypothetical protein